MTATSRDQKKGDWVVEEVRPHLQRERPLLDRTPEASNPTKGGSFGGIETKHVKSRYALEGGKTTGLKKASLRVLSN